ncbi:unnamed protein product [Auanema sp. JU1783]|nr:unnamed protein product [Auanema sp. JU1783]
MSSQPVKLEQTNPVIGTLKAYTKLCSKPSHRSVVISDKTFLGLLANVLNENDPAVMIYVVKILLLLTETKEDSIVLSEVAGLEASIGAASEKNFSPSVLKNLLIVASRIQTSKTQKKQDGESTIPRTGETLSKKFSRKSKQLVFRFYELDEALKAEVEKNLLRTKGVISVYFRMDLNRVIIRTLFSVEAVNIADVIFDCGCQEIVYVTFYDGVEEDNVLYAEDRSERVQVTLPEYLDDQIEVLDPKSCVVTNEYAQAKSTGWFSSISSFVRDTLF